MYSTEIGSAWTRTVDPTDWPLTVEEAKEHLRITDNANDGMIQRYIQAAANEAEDYLGRGLLTQTWKLLLDWWANIIELPMAAPLQSVTSVKYYDAAGVQQTLATSIYDTDLVSRPGRVVLKPDQSWPTAQSLRRNGVIEVVYVVGWTSPELIPDRIKQGCRQFVAYLDLDRDGLEARALEARQAAYRCWSDRIEWTPPTWC